MALNDNIRSTPECFTVGLTFTHLLTFLNQSGGLNNIMTQINTIII